MLKNYIKNKILSKKYRISISNSATVAMSSFFEGKNRIGAHSIFEGEMGRGSYIGSFAWLERVRIGRYCSIANGVMVAVGSHPLSMVSLHPMLFSNAKQNGYSYVNKNYYTEREFVDKENKFDIVIGNDVWIGTRAVILGNIKIGNGAVVAAGAVVTKDVPDYAIVAGVPAKVIRYRFSEEIINKLLEDQWWNKTEDWIENNALFFHDVDKYIGKLIGNEQGDGKNE